MRITLKSTIITLGALGALTLAGCSASGAGETAGDSLSIVAATTPHAEILHHLQDSGALGDLELEIINVTGGEQANAAVAQGNADLNYFQHVPYLEEWQSLSGDDTLLNLGAVHIEPLALYSTKYDSLADIPEGAEIIMPNSGTNLARALLVLADNDLITLPEGAGEGSLLDLGIADIRDNPRNLKFSAVDDFLIARALDNPDIAAGLISGSVAMEAGLSIAENGLVVEAAEGNPYANIVAGTAATAADPAVQDLIDALSSPETGDWIIGQFGDSVIPVNHN